MTKEEAENFNKEDRHIFHEYFDVRLFVSLGAAIMPVVVPLFIWGVGIESRISIQQEQIRMLLEDQKRQDERYGIAVSALKDDLREVSRKLDRLIELPRKAKD